jgi:uncharacterized protein (DUF2249 family)
MAGTPLRAVSLPVWWLHRIKISAPHKERSFAMIELNAVTIAPKDRHPLIFKTFDELKSGTGFILRNDHDPKPLYYSFLHEREGQFEWEYLEQGPVEWKVRISRK